MLHAEAVLSLRHGPVWSCLGYIGSFKRTFYKQLHVPKVCDSFFFFRLQVINFKIRIESRLAELWQRGGISNDVRFALACKLTE